MGTRMRIHAHRFGKVVDYKADNTDRGVFFVLECARDSHEEIWRPLPGYEKDFSRAARANSA